MNAHLFQKLDKVEKTAAGSKLHRLLSNPLKYVDAILFRKLFYPRNERPKILKTKLFFGKMMKVALPAATDIYLTGGKSHVSETRLARFMIKTLPAGAQVLDVGAHFGYFTLLAAELTGPTGQVYAFEPAADSFSLLEENCRGMKHVVVYNKLLSDSEGTVRFHEFPNLYSEYNSMDVEQFRKQQWFNTVGLHVTELEAMTIDSLVGTRFNPQFIKIDVEGAEYKVLLGAKQFLTDASPVIAMEYLHPERGNEEHRNAVRFLRELGYKAHAINARGELEQLVEVDGFLEGSGLESDNIVFRR